MSNAAGRAGKPLWGVSPELVLLLVSVIAAFGWVISKAALEELQPFTFVGWRFGLAALTLLPFAWSQLAGLTREQWWRAMATGLVFSSSMLIWILALERGDSIGVGAFIISLTVVIVPLQARLFFGVQLSPRLFVALIPAVAGLALMSLQGGFSLDSFQAWFFICMLGFSLHLTFSSHYVHNVPALALAFVQAACSGVFGMVAMLVMEGTSRSISFDGWVFILVSSLIATSLRFVMQTRAMQLISASHATMIFTSEPVWTVLLAAVFLGERMEGAQAFGCLLIFTALLIYRIDMLRDFWRDITTREKKV